VLAGGQVGLDSYLHGRLSKLLKSRDLGVRERLEREIGQRRAPLQPQRLPQQFARRRRPRVPERTATLLDEAPEAIEVELPRPHPQPVARPARHQ